MQTVQQRFGAQVRKLLEFLKRFEVRLGAPADTTSSRRTWSDGVTEIEVAHEGTMVNVHYTDLVARKTVDNAESKLKREKQKQARRQDAPPPPAPREIQAVPDSRSQTADSAAFRCVDSDGNAYFSARVKPEGLCTRVVWPKDKPLSAASQSSPQFNSGGIYMYRDSQGTVHFSDGPAASD